MRENLIGTSVRIPKELLARLERMAQRTKWSKGELHRQALELYVSILEGGHFISAIPGQAVPAQDGKPA